MGDFFVFFLKILWNFANLCKSFVIPRRRLSNLVCSCFKARALCLFDPLQISVGQQSFPHHILSPLKEKSWRGRIDFLAPQVARSIRIFLLVFCSKIFFSRCRFPRVRYFLTLSGIFKHGNMSYLAKKKIFYFPKCFLSSFNELLQFWL